MSTLAAEPIQLKSLFTKQTTSLVICYQYHEILQRIYINALIENHIYLNNANSLAYKKYKYGQGSWDGSIDQRVIAGSAAHMAQMSFMTSGCHSIKPLGKYYM